jgi:hypothetical protein
VTGAVRWLLEKGAHWRSEDREMCFAKDVATMYGNEEAPKLLREWAVQKGKCSFSRQEWNAKLNFTLFYSLEHELLYKRARARTIRMLVNHAHYYAWIGS